MRRFSLFPFLLVPYVPSFCPAIGEGVLFAQPLPAALPQGVVAPIGLVFTLLFSASLPPRSLQPLPAQLLWSHPTNAVPLTPLLQRRAQAPTAATSLHRCTLLREHGLSSHSWPCCDHDLPSARGGTNPCSLPPARPGPPSPRPLHPGSPCPGSPSPRGLGALEV